MAEHLALVVKACQYQECMSSLGNKNSVRILGVGALDHSLLEVRQSGSQAAWPVKSLIENSGSIHKIDVFDHSSRTFHYQLSGMR